jgi:hypothetical protein
LHSFFDKLPLVKGAFMKITLNLNNSVCAFTADTGATRNLNQVQGSSSFPLGGVNPIMISSAIAGSGNAGLPAGVTTTYVASVCVGANAIDATARTAGSTTGFLVNASLVCPLYTMNPQYEQAYLANVVRKIDYEDIYQYQVLNVPSNASGGSFNNLITNGIAGLKSVLVIPFHISQNCTIYGARVNQNGDSRISRPCNMCQSVLESQGVKKAIYTFDEDHYGIMRIGE